MVDNAAPRRITHEPQGGSGLKLRTKAAAYGVAGLAVAGVVIFSGSVLGLLGPSSPGNLSVLLTDPPNVPVGVTAVYVSYTDVTVHARGFGDSGWVPVHGSGTIDTMKLVNLSQTISSDMIPSLTYDQIALTITGATIEFDHENYSTAVSTSRLVVPIVGGLTVYTSKPAAALVDIQPTVLNLGNGSNLSFALTAGAQALQVPSDDVNQSTGVMGHQASLTGHGWFESFKAGYSTNPSSAAVLTPDSLSFTIQNNETNPITIRMIMVAPSTTRGEDGALNSIVNNVVFAVQPDGSLQLLSGPPGQVQSYLEGQGFTLAAGASQQFVYSGTLTTLLQGHGVAAGTTYYIVVVGDGTTSVQTLTAS